MGPNFIDDILFADKKLERTRKYKHNITAAEQIGACAQHAQTQRNEIANVRDMAANEIVMQTAASAEYGFSLCHSVWPDYQVNDAFTNELQPHLSIRFKFEFVNMFPPRSLAITHWWFGFRSCFTVLKSTKVKTPIHRHPCVLYRLLCSSQILTGNKTVLDCGVEWN